MFKLIKRLFRRKARSRLQRTKHLRIVTRYKSQVRRKNGQYSRKIPINNFNGTVSYIHI